MDTVFFTEIHGDFITEMHGGFFTEMRGGIISISMNLNESP